MFFWLKVLHLILKLCYTPALVICRQSMSVMTSRLQKRWLQLEPKTKPQICQTHPQSQVQRSFQKNAPIKIIDSHDSNSCKDQDYLLNKFCSSTILHLLPSKNAALWFAPSCPALEVGRFEMFFASTISSVTSSQSASTKHVKFHQPKCRLRHFWRLWGGGWFLKHPNTGQQDETSAETLQK